MIHSLKKTIYSYKEIEQETICVLFDLIDTYLYALIWYGLHKEKGYAIFINEIGDWLTGNNIRNILIASEEPPFLEIGNKEKISEQDISSLISFISLLRSRNRKKVFFSLKNNIKLQRWFLYSIIEKLLDNMDSSSPIGIIMINHLTDYKKLKDKIIKPYLRIPFSESIKVSLMNEEHFKDNFQNGSLGLDKAFLRYNQNSNVSFGSYSYHWVRQSIMFAMKEDSGSIKLPTSMWEHFNKMEKLKSEHLNITDEEIAKKIGITKKRLIYIKKHIKQSRTKSLNYKTGDNMQLYEIIEDVEKKDFDVTFLQDLEPKYKKLLILNYGLYDLLDNDKFL